MEGKHTPPLPWAYTEDEKAEMFSIHTENTDPVDGPNEFMACGIWYQSVGRDTGKAIAELIVNSVNNAPALLEQVEKLKSDYTNAAMAGIELVKEVEKLKSREKELIEALDRIVRSWENSFDEKYAPWHAANELLSRIKQTT